MTDQKPLLIVLSGPTGVGKTSLAIDLAQKYQTEIVSADSRQIYRQLKIGVARPAPAELQAVRHHFIASHDIDKKYSAGMYEKEALNCLEKLFRMKPIVLLVGGTGLYIKAVVEGLDQFPDVSFEKWNRIFEDEGILPLQNELKLRDAEYYGKVDIHNPRRLIRALSVIDTSGKTFSSFLNQQKKSRPFKVLQIALNRERPELYERINARVDKMIVDGLIEEVQGLTSFKHHQALQTVGYREVFQFLNNEMDKEEAISKIKQHSRNYAKRQLTWLKNQGEWHFVHPDDVAIIHQHIEDHV